MCCSLKKRKKCIMINKKQILMVLCIIFNDSTRTHTTPFISIRPQGTNAARALQGWCQYIFQVSKNNTFNTLFTLTTAYTKSNKSGSLAKNLFGENIQKSKWDNASFFIAGSGVEERNKNYDFLADYFGLARDFKSKVFLAPRVDNFIIELDWSLQVDPLCSGLWMRVRVPLTYTKWRLHYQECIIDKGTANHQPGYFNESVTFGIENPAGTYNNAFGVSRDALVQSFSDYASYKKTPNLGRKVQYNALQNAQFLPSESEKNNLFKPADIHINIGYDVWQSSWYHAGLGFALVIPTGNSPKGTYVFEPMVGNNHHWECGGFLTGHVELWHNKTHTQTCTLYSTACITHLFSTKQHRTFDLKNKPNSRYMLAQKMTSNVNRLFVNSTPGNVDDSIPVTLQFDNVFTPVANISTIPVNVSIGWQADAVVMLQYVKDVWSWNIGYNIWGRSCESICYKPSSDDTLQSHIWALKGDAHVYGFSGRETAPNLDPIALSATQSHATITRGTNNFTSINTNLGGINGIRPTRNPGADNALFARAESNATSNLDNINDRPDNLGLQTMTSKNPYVITKNNLDIDGAKSKGLSHSFFAGFCYKWHHEHLDYIPYISTAGQAEFNKNDCPKNTSNNCKFCGISQWSVWLKGGIYFN